MMVLVAHMLNTLAGQQTSQSFNLLSLFWLTRKPSIIITKEELPIQISFSKKMSNVALNVCVLDNIPAKPWPTAWQGDAIFVLASQIKF